MRASGASISTSSRWRWTATAIRCSYSVDQVDGGLPYGSLHVLLHRLAGRFECRPARSPRVPERVIPSDHRCRRYPTRRRSSNCPCSHRVIPVTRRAVGRRRDSGRRVPKARRWPGPFSLESAEHGASGATWSRYSFIGVRSIATLGPSGTVRRCGWGSRRQGGGNAISVLRETVRLVVRPAWPAIGARRCRR